MNWKANDDGLTVQLSESICCKYINNTFVPPVAYGSHCTMFAVCETVIVPPYCGIPRLSHQLPVALVVTVEVIAVGVVVVGTTALVVDVVVEIIVVVVDVVTFVVVDAVPQDASSSAATNTKAKPNQIILCFTFHLHFIYDDFANTLSFILQFVKQNIENLLENRI